MFNEFVLQRVMVTRFHSPNQELFRVAGDMLTVLLKILDNSARSGRYAAVSKHLARRRYCYPLHLPSPGLLIRNEEPLLIPHTHIRTFPGLLPNTASHQPGCSPWTFSASLKQDSGPQQTRHCPVQLLSKSSAPSLLTSSLSSPRRMAITPSAIKLAKCSSRSSTKSSIQSHRHRATSLHNKTRTQTCSGWIMLTRSTRFGHHCRNIHC